MSNKIGHISISQTENVTIEKILRLYLHRRITEVFSMKKTSKTALMDAELSASATKGSIITEKGVEIV